MSLSLEPFQVGDMEVSPTVVIPCNAIRTDKRAFRCMEGFVTFQIYKSSVHLVLLPDGLPSIAIRVESEANKCQMTHFDGEMGDNVVMILDVTLAGALPQRTVRFWSESPDEPATFVKLGVRFEPRSPSWSREKYKAFALAMASRFSDENWAYLDSPEKSSAAWDGLKKCRKPKKRCYFSLAISSRFSEERWVYFSNDDSATAD